MGWWARGSHRASRPSSEPSSRHASRPASPRRRSVVQEAPAGYSSGLSSLRQEWEPVLLESTMDGLIADRGGSESPQQVDSERLISARIQQNDVEEVCPSEQESVSSTGWGVWRGKGNQQARENVELPPNEQSGGERKSREMDSATLQKPVVDEVDLLSSSKEYTSPPVRQTNVDEMEPERMSSHRRSLTPSYRDGWEADEEGSIHTSEDEAEDKLGEWDEQALRGWKEEVPPVADGENLHDLVKVEDDRGLTVGAPTEVASEDTSSVPSVDDQLTQARVVSQAVGQGEEDEKITSDSDSSQSAELEAVSNLSKPVAPKSAAMADAGNSEDSNSSTDSQAERKSRLWNWAIMGPEGVPAVINDESPAKAISKVEETVAVYKWPPSSSGSDSGESDFEEEERGIDAEEMVDVGLDELPGNRTATYAEGTDTMAGECDNKAMDANAEDGPSVDGSENKTLLPASQMPANDNNEAVVLKAEQEEAAASDDNCGGFGSPFSLGPGSCQASPDKRGLEGNSEGTMTAFSLEDELEEDARRPVTREGTGPFHYMWLSTGSHGGSADLKLEETGSQEGKGGCLAKDLTKGEDTETARDRAQQEVEVRIEALEALSLQLEAENVDVAVEPASGKSGRRRVHPYERIHQKRKGWSRGRIEDFAGLLDDQAKGEESRNFESRDAAYPRVVLAAVGSPESEDDRRAAAMKVAGMQGVGEGRKVKSHTSDGDAWSQGATGEQNGDVERGEGEFTEDEDHWEISEESLAEKPEGGGKVEDVVEQHDNGHGNLEGENTSSAMESKGSGHSKQVEQLDGEVNKDGKAWPQRNEDHKSKGLENWISTSGFAENRQDRAVHSWGESHLTTVKGDDGREKGQGEEQPLEIIHTPAIEASNQIPKTAEMTTEMMTHGSHSRLKNTRSLPTQRAVVTAWPGLEGCAKNLKAERDSLLVEREALERQWQEGRDELNRAAEMAQALRAALDSLTKAHARRLRPADNDEVAEREEATQHLAAGAGPHTSQSVPTSPPKMHQKAAKPTSVPTSPKRESRNVELMPGAAASSVGFDTISSTEQPPGFVDSEAEKRRVSLAARFDSQAEDASCNDKSGQREAQRKLERSLSEGSTWRVTTNGMTFGTSADSSANARSLLTQSLDEEVHQAVNETARLTTLKDSTEGRGEFSRPVNGSSDDSLVALPPDLPNANKVSFHVQLHRMQAKGRKDKRWQPAERQRRWMHIVPSSHQAGQPWEAVPSDSSNSEVSYDTSSDYGGPRTNGKLKVPSLLANGELPQDEHLEQPLLDRTERFYGQGKKAQLTPSPQSSRGDLVDNDYGDTYSPAATSSDVTSVTSSPASSVEMITGSWDPFTNSNRNEGVTGQQGRARWQDRTPWTPSQIISSSAPQSKAAQTYSPLTMDSSPFPCEPSLSRVADSTMDSQSPPHLLSSSSSVIPDGSDSAASCFSPSTPGSHSIPFVPVYGPPSPGILAGAQTARTFLTNASGNQRDLLSDAQASSGWTNEKPASSSLLSSVPKEEAAASEAILGQSLPTPRRKWTFGAPQNSISQDSSAALSSSSWGEIRGDEGQTPTSVLGRGVGQPAATKTSARFGMALPYEHSETSSVSTASIVKPPRKSQPPGAEAEPRRPINNAVAGRKKLPAFWPTASDTEDEGFRVQHKFGSASGQTSKLGLASGLSQPQQAVRKESLGLSAAAGPATKARGVPVAKTEVDQGKAERLAAGVVSGQVRSVPSHSVSAGGGSVQPRWGPVGRNGTKEPHSLSQGKAASQALVGKLSARAHEDETSRVPTVTKIVRGTSANQGAPIVAPAPAAVAAQAPAAQVASARSSSKVWSRETPVIPGKEAAPKDGQDGARTQAPPPDTGRRGLWGAGSKRASSPTPTRSKSPLRSLWTNVSASLRS